MTEPLETMRLTGHASICYLQNKLQISFDEAVSMCIGLVFPPIGFIPLDRAPKSPALHDIPTSKIKRGKCK